MTTTSEYDESATAQFNTGGNRFVVNLVVPACTVLLAIAVIFPVLSRPYFIYPLLGGILAALGRLAGIAASPWQPRCGARTSSNRPWPSTTCIVTNLIVAAVGIVFAFTCLYFHAGQPSVQSSALVAIGTMSTVGADVTYSGTLHFAWVFATQQIADLLFFTFVVTIALGRIR